MSAAHDKKTVDIVSLYRICIVYQTYSGSCKSGVDCTIPRHPVYYGQLPERRRLLCSYDETLAPVDGGGAGWQDTPQHWDQMTGRENWQYLKFNLHTLMLSTNIRTHPLNGLE